MSTITFVDPATGLPMEVADKTANDATYLQTANLPSLLLDGVTFSTSGTGIAIALEYAHTDGDPATTTTYTLSPDARSSLTLLNEVINIGNGASKHWFVPYNPYSSTVRPCETTTVSFTVPFSIEEGPRIGDFLTANSIVTGIITLIDYVGFTVTIFVISSATLNVQIDDLLSRVSFLETHRVQYLGTYATYSAMPNTVAGFQIYGFTPQLDDYAIVTADETHGGDTSQYLVTAIDVGSGIVTMSWAFSMNASLALKANKVTGTFTVGNFAGLNASGDITDSGSKASDISSKVPLFPSATENDFALFNTVGGIKSGGSTIGTSQITDGAITAAKIAAGAGGIPPDNVTLEKYTDAISGSDMMRIKALGVDTAQVKDGAITSAKLATGAGGTPPDDATLEIYVDPNTSTDKLRVKDEGITAAKLAKTLDLSVGYTILVPTPSLP